MSYDLVFWRQRKPISLPPVEVYRKLNTRANLEGRLDLPAVAELPVDQILTRLKAAYPDFNPSDRPACFMTPDARYDVSWSQKHFSFTIHGDLGDSLNPLVEIMGQFGCPMFDPQKNERHDAAHGLAVATVPKFKSPTAEEKLARKKSYDAILSQAGLSPAERTTKIIKIALGTCIVIILIMVIWIVKR